MVSVKKATLKKQKKLFFHLLVHFRVFLVPQRVAKKKFHPNQGTTSRDMDVSCGEHKFLPIGTLI